MVTYITEDGEKVQTGDSVYDYYTMEQCRIGNDKGGGWFETLKAERSYPDVRSTSGTLNGERICTIEYARRYNLPGADAPTQQELDDHQSAMEVEYNVQ